MTIATVYEILTKPCIKKIIFVVLSILIFSIIYMFFDNREFGGFMDVEQKFLDQTERERLKKKIFKQYAGNKNYLNKEDFIKIPIVKIEGNILIIKPENMTDKLKLKNGELTALFNLYQTNDRLSFELFDLMPITMGYYDMDIDDINKFFEYKTNSVINYFDRLYYSVIVQSSLGLGDVFPNTRKLRTVTMFQALTTFIIFIIN